MRRLVRNDPDPRLAADVMRAPVLRNGVTFREALPPGPERDAAIARNLADFAKKAGPLDARAVELRDLVRGHAPVGLILGIVIPGSMGFAGGDDAGTTVMWSAQIEYLSGLAASAPAATKVAPVTVIKHARRLLRSVFDAARAQHMRTSMTMELSEGSPLEEALFMLRWEHLIDRMDGYAVHLEQIDAEIFDRHRDTYVNAIGFNPADVHRVVRKLARVGNEALNRSVEEVAQLRGVDDDEAGRRFAEMVQSLDSTRIWIPAVVAATTGVDTTEVAAMLQCFATTFGSQPEFRLPTDHNVIRTKPAIDLGDGSYLVGDPWALTSAVHLRLAELGQAGDTQFPGYRRHREDGHQRVVTGAFTRVFGDAVAEGSHYSSKADGPGEIDTMVVASWPLIAEAKAHGMTLQGRKGAIDRVKAKVHDILEKSFEQTARANRFIVDERGRAFAPRQNGTPAVLLPDDIDGATDVVVTFERMDPLAALAQGLAGQPGRPVWVVNAADLLMVVDLLNDPAALHHYVRTRAATAAAQLRVFMESDALSGYLQERLATQLAHAAEDPEIGLLLGYSSTAINEYFTLNELRQPAVRPTTGVPPAVTAALTAGFTARAPSWVAAADAVMNARVEVWSKWQRFCRRHRGHGRFALGSTVMLMLAQDPALVEVDGVVEIHVPTGDER